MKDIGTHVVESGEYSLEFVKQGVFLLVFIRFWRKNELCRVFLKRTGRVLGQSAAELQLISDVMAVFSTSPNIVCCSGSTVETIQDEADEAVNTSLKMMESLVERASRLSLGTSQLPHGGRVTTNKPGYRAPTPGPQSGMTSGEASDTSGALRSSDDFESIDYAYEHSDLESQPFASPPVALPGCSRVDPGSAEVEFQVDSPGAQTLAVLKAEAAAERSKASSRKRPRKKTTSNSSVNRHRVPRACKIMKEAYFKGMEWTKTFVSGPVDPRWNPYKF